MRRKANENYRNFEARFSAQASKVASHGVTISVDPRCLAMILLIQARVDDSQHVTIISSAGAKEGGQADATTDDMIKSRSYEEVA